MFDNEDISLTPINFFSLGLDCYYREFDEKKELGQKFYLPDTSALCSEETFAQVAIAWGYEGLTIHVKLEDSFDQAFYPAVSHGDSIELFIDTRDVKTSGYNTRFCHHFFFLPKEVEGHKAGEKTHFRTEDRHEWCDPSQLLMTASSKKSSPLIKIFIPAQCLCGYDPEQFDRIGFAYRINRFNGTPQHLSAVSQDYQLEQQPSLWSSMRLINENGTA